MKNLADRNLHDVWEDGHAYETFMGRWSRPVAELFLPWLSVPPKSSWLDVGCGTGVLSRAILEHASPSRVRGIDLAPGFVAFVRHHLSDPRISFEAAALETLSDEHGFDAVVSALVLNFMPDPREAVAAMKRIVVPGGTVAAYVWDYADGMQFLRHFWDAAVQCDPEAEALHEGNRFPLCEPDALVNLFVTRGLKDVQVRPIDVATRFMSFEEYWSPFLDGQGPAPGYIASLTGERQSELRDRVRARLPEASDGTIELTARAWAVRGTA